MPVFDELNNKNRKLADPEAREAEELTRSKKKYDSKNRLKKTSVTASQFYATMIGVKLLIAVVVIGVIAAAVWYGVNQFIS